MKISNSGKESTLFYGDVQRLAQFQLVQIRDYGFSDIIEYGENQQFSLSQTDISGMKKLY